MSYDIRKPMITESTERGQLLQIKSYLIQLVDQLNYTLRMLEDRANKGASVEGTAEINLTPALFAEIKSLIMKSSDIINAYYKKMEPMICESEALFAKIGKKFDAQFAEGIEAHNVDAGSHTDIRELIKKLSDKLNELPGGSDETLERLAAVIATAEANKTAIEKLTEKLGELEDGADGVSPTVEVNKTESVTTITITDVNGTQTATINDGYTPVKGTDYYTEADKNEMVSMVLAALPTWSGGSY